MTLDVNGQIKLSEYENVLIVPVKSRQQAVQAIAEQEQAKYPLAVEIKQKRPKKSRNANDACWVLCTAISEEVSKDKTPISKEEVYRRAIRETNHYYSVPIPDEGVEQYQRIWESNGIGWIAEVAYKSHTLEGYTTIHSYYGSSEYDSKRMYRLLEILNDEAAQLGLETIEDYKMRKLIEEWDKSYKKREEKEKQECEP